MYSRRQVIAGLGAVSLFGCDKTPTATPTPGTGWMVAKGPKILGANFKGQSTIGAQSTFGANAPFRIASITKLVVGLAVYDWASKGLLNVDRSVANVFPNAPEGVTLANLLSHRSGLKDPQIYWADIGTDIRTLFDASNFTHAPDTYFRYANLNYGLVATVVETRLNERFDLLMWKWLTRHGLDAGLNWSGISPRKRGAAATLYRKSETGAWTATIDAPSDIPLATPTYLGRNQASLKTYQPGTNGTLFSPQGGMRMSLTDLLKIGQILKTRQTFHKAVWSFDGGNAETEMDHFLSFGPANYIYTEDISPVAGVPLVGHLGEAYGAYTGLFIVPGTDLSFAFASLGTPNEGLTMNGARANQSVEHQALFDALAPTLRAHI